ncbi:glycosyltransferase family 2 protein [Sinorhizobium sp. CCBAU 05631]|uniref:glycosyltransferase family 2 protein n=1 Tax=Sinorhizobium sp. CCBAU 05631 TaxID=794846 RepID=UPI000680A3EE|nr:glycosyltransferase family 2 protein [Sinorhizobium sp. CCBAU 05631]
MAPEQHVIPSAVRPESTKASPSTGASTTRIAIGIASAGRREVLSAVLPLIARQTRRPDEVIVCLCSTADIDQHSIDMLDCPGKVILSQRGLCRQRNAILTAVTADVVLFLDDDFLMAPDYLGELERLFEENPGIAMSTGTVVADGIIGPGISIEVGLETIDATKGKPRAAERLEPVYNAYGCNMAIRMAAVRRGQLRFDENLPLYGWLEDVDFSRLVAAHGSIVRSNRLLGVHLGTKISRTPGVKFGYSQIANPIYLVRKKTMSLPIAAVQVARNLIANIVKVWKPEPWVDRKGRLRGNARACLDLFLGRLGPRNVEGLE